MNCTDCGKELKTGMFSNSHHQESTKIKGVCGSCAYIRSEANAGQKAEARAKAEAQAKLKQQQRTAAIKNVTLTTGFTTAAGEIKTEIDVISAEVVFGVNAFKDFMGGVRDVVGGRAKTHQKVLKDLKEAAKQELREAAFDLGADAVIGVDLDYSEISGGNGGLLMLVANGTAVKLKKAA